MVTIFCLRGSDFREGRVERRGLSASRGPGHQHHPVGLADELAESFQLALGNSQHVEAELTELLADRLLVEDADDDVLPVDARHDRHPEVDRPTSNPELEPPVLGNPPLGDVELGHHFQPRHDGLVVLVVDGLHRRVEDTVDPVLESDMVLLGLHVDVARAALDAVEKQGVDQLDDGASALRDLPLGARSDSSTSSSEEPRA